MQSSPTKNNAVWPWVEQLLKIFPNSIGALVRKHWEILVYIFFGGCTTLVSFGVQWGCLLIGWPTAVNTTVSWICAVLFAFFTNRIWVFCSPTSGTLDFIKQMLSFFGARLFSFGVELLIMLLFVSQLGFPEMGVKIGASIIVLVLNYFLSKWWVFRSKT